MNVYKTPHQKLIAVKRRMPPVKSQAWRAMVEYRLGEGFGVEDIAIQLHCSADTVRQHVRDLMAWGRFKVNANA